MTCKLFCEIAKVDKDLVFYVGLALLQFINNLIGGFLRLIAKLFVD